MLWVIDLTQRYSKWRTSISKWLIKYLSQAVFNQNVEINKIGKYFQTVHGLDETKALIIKEMVNFLIFKVISYLIVLNELGVFVFIIRSVFDFDDLFLMEMINFGTKNRKI